MGVSSQRSLIISGTLSCMIYLSICYFKHYLSSSQGLTFFAGYVGSLLFMLTLTAINNYMFVMSGEQSQTRYLHVSFSLLVAVSAVFHVHRVAVTSCILFSLATLYLLNRISDRTYQTNNNKMKKLPSQQQKDNKQADNNHNQSQPPNTHQKHKKRK